MTWILIIFLKVGAFSAREAYTSVMVPGFSSQLTCESAGRQAMSRLATGRTDGEFVCLPHN